MYNAIEITALFVFGTNNPSPDDYNEHFRPSTATPASITYNMSDYMTTGGGRFAYPSLFGAVEKFFNATGIPDGTYNLTEMSAILGLSSDDLTTNISQYSTGIGSTDHSERSYIFGNTSFSLAPSMTFEVVGGNKQINNLEVLAEPDNFDFESRPGSYSQLINDFLLQPTFDPYELGRGAVTINYTGSGKTYSVYDHSLFTRDQGLESDVNGSLLEGIASLFKNDGFSDFSNIADDTFLSYKKENKTVIYGTLDNDDLDRFDGENWINIPFEAYLIVGGDGNDTLSGSASGDELQGGSGNDFLIGGFGDDTFIGGAGNDMIHGSSFLFGLFQETDTSVYEGAFTDYELEFLPDGSIRITDTVSGRDGSDTLKGVDFAQFADKTIDLSHSPGGESNQALVAKTDQTVTVDEDALSTPLNITALTDINGDPLTITVDIIPNSIQGEACLVDNASISINQVLTPVELQNADRDSLTGTEQSDHIIGLQSRDPLTGDVGDDIFRYTGMVDAGDIVTDFEVASDKIDLVGIPDSIGFTGTDPIIDSYVGFHDSQCTSTILTVDPDGFAGIDSAHSFILFQEVAPLELNNFDNFIF